MVHSGIFVWLIISAVVIIAGVVLLVLSIKKAKSKGKRIAGIIGGGIMIGGGALLSCYFILVLLMVSAVDNYSTSSTNRSILSFEYHTSEGYCFQYERLAKKGFSGEAIDYSEAKELADMIYSIHPLNSGDTEDSVYVHDDIEVYCFKDSVSNYQGEEYTYYCEVISRAPDEDLVGIQYIRLEQDGEIIKELGAKPVFD